MNPKVSNKIIRNNAKRLDARVMKSNSSASSMRKSSEIDDQVLKSEGITNPRNVRKVMNATKKNRHIVMLSPGYSKSTDTLAHELGHVQNANSKNPIVKVIHEVSGRNKRINPEDRGIGNIIKNSISHKLRINEEARASRNAMKMLKNAGATEEQWHEGILYSAFTRDEVNSMYNWIVNNLVDKEDPLTGRTLRLDDIIVLHSDYTAAGTDKDLWLNRPREIANKKIVLCTHAKLLDEPLHLLVASNFNQPLSDVIGPLAASVIGGSNSLLPRQWILIDESTEAKSEKFKVSKSMIMALGTLSDRVNNVSRVDPMTGRIIYSSSLLPTIFKPIP